MSREKSSEGKTLILNAWDWGQEIGVYALGIAQDIMAGTRTTLNDVDFAAQFDATDPGIILTVVENAIEPAVRAT